MKRFHKDTRVSENFTIQGLETLAGQPEHAWTRYICKEIIDNALEESQKPEITVTAHCSRYDGLDKLSIRDSGPGIEEKFIHHIFQDIEHFGGSKKHYQLPTRGCQGNALMTLLGMQHQNNGPLIVTSNDRQYKIRVVKNELEGSYEIEIDADTVKNIQGLKITINAVDSYNQLVETFYKFIELNPQAAFKMVTRYDNEEPEVIQAQPGTCSGHSLSLNQSTTSGKVIWFTLENFSERMKADYRAAPELCIREFISEFLGLASGKKQKAVMEHAGLDGEVQTIGDFFTEKQMKESMVRSLYEAMKYETEPFNTRGVNKTLGSIGEDGLACGLLNTLKLKMSTKTNEPLLHGLKTIIKKAKENGDFLKREELFTYYADGDVVETDEKTIPFYFEMMAVPTRWKKQERWDQNIDLTFGINQSFLYSNPSLELNIKTQNNRSRKYRSFESAFRDLDYDFKIICNLTCPNVEYQDKGKQSFNTEPFKPVFEDVLGKTIRKIKREIIPILNRINRNPKPSTPTLSGKAPKGFIRDFVFENFKTVYNQATDNGRYTLTQRQFYYPMRDMFMKTAKENGYTYSSQSTPKNPKKLKLKYETFCGYIDDYEREVLGERIIYKDNRGFFVEPHSDKRIDLGTTAVEQYRPDLDQYNSLLFVEKTGFYELLHKDFKLSKKYDIALINSKGYANNAARNLVEKIQAAKANIRLYTLTDFDIKGLGIAEDVAKADELSAMDIFNCERLGITLEDIQTYDLSIEPAQYKDKVFSELENSCSEGYISDEEYNFLKQNQRVEINAFTPVELIDYLEEKFYEHGIRKLEPASPAEVETLQVESIEKINERTIHEAVGNYLIAVSDDLKEYLEKKLDVADTEDEVQHKLRALLKDQDLTLFREIKDQLDKLPLKNWPQINDELVKKKQKEVDLITKQYQEEVLQNIQQIFDDTEIELSFT